MKRDGCDPDVLLAVEGAAGSDPPLPAWVEQASGPGLPRPPGSNRLGRLRVLFSVD